MLDQSSEANKQTKAKQEEAAQQLQQKQQQESNLVEQLKCIVSEKEKKVHQLEEEIREIKTRVRCYGPNIYMHGWVWGRDEEEEKCVARGGNQARRQPSSCSKNSSKRLFQRKNRRCTSLTKKSGRQRLG